MTGWQDQAEFVLHKYFDLEIGTMSWRFDQADRYLMCSQAIKNFGRAAADDMNSQLWPLAYKCGEQSWQ